MSSTSESVPTGLVGQAFAGIGAVLCLLFAFGTALPAIGVACLFLGVLISAPDARNPGPHLTEWWTVLAVAALACLSGFGLHYAAEVPGNILLAIGAVTALVAVGLGSPAEPD